MMQFTDRTLEVERRVAAIWVHPQDHCAFFIPRDDLPAAMRDCWHCTFGSFDKQVCGSEADGLCKYKK